MVDFDLPTPPTPDARFSMVVEIPGDQKELDPGQEGSIQAEVSKEAREAGITTEPVTISQDTATGTGQWLGGGEVIEPPRLNALDFAFEEGLLGVDQLSRARRIIIAALRKYEVVAREENVYVRAVSPIDLGSL